VPAVAIRDDRVADIREESCAYRGVLLVRNTLSGSRIAIPPGWSVRDIVDRVLAAISARRPRTAATTAVLRALSVAASPFSG
jgi:hypothetical protein